MSIDLFRCESNKYFGIVSLDSIAFIHHKGNGVNIFISSQAESHKGLWGVNSLGDLRFRESAFVFAAAQKPSGRDNEQIINLLWNRFNCIRLAFNKRFLINNPARDGTEKRERTRRRSNLSPWSPHEWTVLNSSLYAIDDDFSLVFFAPTNISRPNSPRAERGWRRREKFHAKESWARNVGAGFFRSGFLWVFERFGMFSRRRLSWGVIFDYFRC